MKERVILDNMGYKRRKRALMVLNHCSSSFYCTVYAFLSEIWLGRNSHSFGYHFYFKNPAHVNNLTFSMSALTVGIYLYVRAMSA